ncbi:NAD(P)-dependent oxidoreductase [Aspergillus alliaceus]|uniref:NAD(P)-dependent oxidoreductase n=1 Tax=Petromyces alliaceus TaxID=209559 RepID=UPI0012A6F30B|nr:NAD binding domain of 6-phosphogluconate dehydrogenase-domain-containing protein [Aspergillus alliaceus]KAB8227787.1 NAD binding domain of 6-phosphogluconate dehydrogenase-domain-containing protein [Aspergillus alliaceus]
MDSSRSTSLAAAGDTHPKIGWIGLGSMGLAMASNLQNHLSRIGAPPLRFYNRTETRGQPILDIGGIHCASIEDLIIDVDICFIAVSDDAAVTSIINSILAADPLHEKIIADTSTVHPDISSWARRELALKGAEFVAAPVFGASPVAREGRLLFVIAGADEAVRAIEPFLEGVMARKTLHLGADVTKASLLKTTGNFLTAGMMELVAEAQVFAEKTGLGSDVLESLIQEQYGSLPFSMSKRMTEGSYLPKLGERPWSDLQLALKDVGLGASCAERVGANLPIANLVLKHLGEARQYGQATQRALDSSSMYGVLRQHAGLDFESDLVKERDSSSNIN